MQRVASGSPASFFEVDVENKDVDALRSIRLACVLHTIETMCKVSTTF